MVWGLLSPLSLFLHSQFDLMMMLWCVCVFVLVRVYVYVHWGHLLCEGCLSSSRYTSNHLHYSKHSHQTRLNVQEQSDNSSDNGHGQPSDPHATPASRGYRSRGRRPSSPCHGCISSASAGSGLGGVTPSAGGLGWVDRTPRLPK